MTGWQLDKENNTTRADQVTLVEELAHVQDFMGKTRQYARRQMQWFRGEGIVPWIPAGSDWETDSAEVVDSIERLWGLDRAEYEQTIHSDEQITMREQHMADGQAMKRYVSQRKLILPGSDEEKSLIDAAESAAKAIRTAGCYL